MRLKLLLDIAIYFFAVYAAVCFTLTLTVIQVREAIRLLILVLRCFEETGLVELNRNGKKIVGLIVKGKVQFKL